MQKENLNKTNIKVGLERFNKNKKLKRVIIGSIVGLIVLIGGITLYRTFALYEEKKEFNVLTGRVPYFIDYKGMLREVKVDNNEIPYEDYYAEKEHITKVVLENKIVPKETEKVYDVSVNKDGSVMAYLVANETDSTKYTLYLQADGKIKGNINSNYMFASLSSVESVEGLENLDLQYTTSLNNMFMYCSSLKELDLSSLNTSNITSMIGMFNGCSSLTNLNLNGFDTRKVTVIAGMFRDCSSLTSIDLSSFDTSNVERMHTLFINCTSLQNINFGENFKTENVNYMQHMFYGCNSLKTIDLSRFQTTNVTNMESMFKNCSELESINFGENFKTENVNYMQHMFYGCTNLASLDVSGFDTRNVRDMSAMFFNCANLTNIIVTNFNTSQVVNMNAMFQECSKITELDLSSFDTRNVTEMRNMFSSEISNLKTIIYGANFIRKSGADVTAMFYHCYANRPTHSSWDGAF